MGAPNQLSRWHLRGQRCQSIDQEAGDGSLRLSTEATVERDGRTTLSRRCDLSSARLSAATLAHTVRAHWPIENGVHWVLDVSFDKDRTRSREDHGPEHLATLRNLALNRLRRVRPDISFRHKRQRCG